MIWDGGRYDQISGQAQRVYCVHLMIPLQCAVHCGLSLCAYWAWALPAPIDPVIRT
jgi:hypothetical protein